MYKIPKIPRFEYVLKMTYKFIEENNIKEYQFDIIELIKKNNWCIYKYSDLEKECRHNNKEICKYLASSDAKTYLEINKNNYLYVITYNDNLNTNTKERIRFTLAHEIGHIYLGHLKYFKETEIHRKGISKNSYGILEKEADIFARNILCPYPLLKNIMKDFDINEFNINFIMKKFGISRKASEIRLKMINKDKPRCETLLNNSLNTLHKYNILGKNIKSNITSMEDSNIMKYTYYEYIKCDKCGNENILENSNFCYICGVDLRNICINEDCENNNSNLPKNARFCNLCGCKSIFYKENKLNDWEKEFNLDISPEDLNEHDDLPF